MLKYFPVKCLSETLLKHEAIFSLQEQNQCKFIDMTGQKSSTLWVMCVCVCVCVQAQKAHAQMKLKMEGTCMDEGKG